MTLSKSEALKALGRYDPAALRPALARLAAQTPGIHYFSSDLPSETILPNCRAGLNVLVGAGLGRIKSGEEAAMSFDGLSGKNGSYGDWVVSATRKQISPVETNDLTQLESELAAMDPEALRPILSEALNLTPATMIMQADLGEALPLKKIGKSDTIDALGQAAMYLCSKLRDVFEPGESRDVQFIAFAVGASEGDLWTIRVTRVSGEQAGE